jgi:hypothetical protein
MHRPDGVTAIAVICFLYAGYLGASAAWMLVYPRSASLIPSVEDMPTLKRTVPYIALLMGLCWTVFGRGLLEFRNWARWAIIIVAIWGIVSGLAPRLYYSPMWEPFLCVGLQIIARIVIVWYLLRASVARQFSQSATAA